MQVVIYIDNFRGTFKLTCIHSIPLNTKAPHGQTIFQNHNYVRCFVNIHILASIKSRVPADILATMTWYFMQGSWLFYYSIFSDRSLEYKYV